METAISNFRYCVPTRAVFGRGTIDQVGELVPKGSGVLLVYGGGSIKKNGIYERVVRIVKPAAEFGGIEPNPDYETCMRAVAVVRTLRINFILAVGGGSVVDAAKFISVAAGWTTTPDPWDILARFGDGGDRAYEPQSAVPLGVVLTLPATGTEMNCNAVISYRARHLKMGFAHRLVYPVFSVLDPEATYSLPKRQIANGLADALCHVLEQYTAHFNVGLVQDEQCEAIMRAIIAVAPKALADSPPSYKARADFFWATTQALNGLIGLGVPQCWATHQVAYRLTAYYGLDHATTLAIVFGPLMRHLKAARSAKLARMAERVFGVTGAADMAEEAIVRCEAFFKSLGFGLSLTANGCNDSHFEEIRKSFEGRTLGPERLISPNDVIAILKAAL